MVAGVVGLVLVAGGPKFAGYGNALWTVVAAGDGLADAAATVTGSA